VIVKAAATARPEVFRDTFQQCLLDGVFPKRCKKMKLVLLPKGKGPANAPRSYRPLCLMDIAGKLFEHLLYARIEPITESPTGLQGQQASGRGKVRSSLSKP